MITTTKIKMDLANPTGRIRIDAVQDDRYSRAIQLNLYSGGTAYTPPSNMAVLVRYRKSDGTGGVYDTLPDGSAAWSVSGNAVTVALAPQVCTAPGSVALTVSLVWGDAQLSSFGLEVYVHPQPRGNFRSEPYSNIAGFLPQPTGAEVGQYLKVTAVENGRITGLSTGAPASVGTGSSNDVPDYVTAEAARLASAVQARQNANTVSFLACSDAHCSTVHTYAGQMMNSVLHCGQAMAQVADRIHLDFAAMLGDLVWDGGECANDALTAMTFVNTALADSFGSLPNFRARGNHDCLSAADSGLTDSQIFARIGIYNSGAEYDPEDRVGGYCYRDFPEQKLRVILLNTCQVGDGGFAVSDAQVTWFGEALDLSALGDGWGSVVLSHHPLDWYGSGQPVVQALAAAENVLCCVHGHVHNYKVDTVTGTSIPRIAIPNICFYRNNEYGANGIPENSEGTEFGQTLTFPKTADSAEDTAFCVITLDRGTGVLYADHYGAGYSRAVGTAGVSVDSHSVTLALTGVTAGAVPEAVDDGAAFAVRLAPDAGYTLSSVAVSMGGEDVTSGAFDGNTIAISSVTGDLVITAAAIANDGSTGTDKDTDTDDTDTDTGTDTDPDTDTDNLVSTSIDEDGSIFDGCGYRTGYRLSSSGNLSVLEGAIVSGYIAYSGQALEISGSKASTAGTLGNYLALYDSSFAKINILGFDNLINYGAVWSQGDTWTLTIDPASITNETVVTQLAAAAYIRASLGLISDAGNFCVTATE